MRKFAIKIITIFQLTAHIREQLMVSFFGPTYGTCRYFPTCSEYMKQAMQKYGVGKGLSLGISRILRCHPKTEGGLDPVL